MPQYATYIEQLNDIEQLTVAHYYDVFLKKRFVDNIVFIGDAAHALSPHLSSGTNLALLDAKVLAESLQAHEDISIALRTYNDQRESQIKFYYHLSKWITPFFQSKKNNAFYRDYLLKELMKVPFVNKMMLQTILGIKAGLFSTIDKKYYL